MFDGSYFRNYAVGFEDWERGYRARLYYYRSLSTALLRLKSDVADVAEIGCGLGMFSYCLLSRAPGLALRASDISQYAVDVARKKLAKFNNAQVETGDAENVSLPTSSFDAVISLDVVEHLLHPESMISEVSRILRPGGVFLFTTPNGRSIGARFKRRASKAQLASVAGSRWLWFADRDATHVNVRNPNDWRNLCLSMGLQLVRDGSDGCWDTPYVRGIPLIVQKIICNGSHRILMRITPRLPWLLGENYIGFWRKP